MPNDVVEKTTVGLSATELDHLIRALTGYVDDLYFGATKSRRAKTDREWQQKAWNNYDGARGLLETLRNARGKMTTKRF